MINIFGKNIIEFLLLLFISYIEKNSDLNFNYSQSSKEKTLIIVYNIVYVMLIEIERGR